MVVLYLNALIWRSGKLIYRARFGVTQKSDHASELTMDQNLPSPMSLVKLAIKSVPAVKYALGVGGIIAIIALIRSFKVDFRIAVFGGVIMLILMTLLVIFASLAAQRGSSFHVPALVFAWFSLTLTMATALALFLSVFAGWPLELRTLVAASHTQAGNSNAVTAPQNDSLAPARRPEATDSEKQSTEAEPPKEIWSETLRYPQGISPKFDGDPLSDEHPCVGRKCILFTKTPNENFGFCDDPHTIKNHYFEATNLNDSRLARLLIKRIVPGDPQKSEQFWIEVLPRTTKKFSTPCSVYVHSDGKHDYFYYQHFLLEWSLD